MPGVMVVYHRTGPFPLLSDIRMSDPVEFGTLITG
jgi:hypothetical protein